MRPTAVAILCIAICSRVQAQGPTDPHAVQPERPTVATHAGVVAPAWLEIETGVERDRLAGQSSLLFPTVLKIGLGRRVQLNVAVPVVGLAGQTAGPGDGSVGVKFRLADDAPLLREFAILPSVKLPSGNSDQGRGTATTDWSLLVISSRTVGRFAIDLNAGITARNGDGTNAPTFAALWTVSVGAEVRGPVGWVGEVFGYPGTGGPAGLPPIVAVLTGPTYAVRPWLAFDVGIIVPVTGPQPHAWYVGSVVNAGRFWPAHPSRRRAR